MRLLRREPNDKLTLHKYISKDVPPYAILSHTWGKEEITLHDLEAGKHKSKAGWRKISFCASKAHADGLQNMWIDTCCIDKKDAVELSEAINSMFRWYQRAVRCYVYLSDVSVSAGQQGDSHVWEGAFRRSRWFTRGWTLQELIAPTHVEFYSSEGECLGSKVSLAPIIANVTGIPEELLLGGTLSNYSVSERKSWAERRDTTIEEDAVYSQLGIFGVTIPLIYGEGRDNASRRLEEEVHKSYKGPVFENYTVRLDKLSIPNSADFVGREKELAFMYQTLCTSNTRSSIVLHGLGGIGKTQLALRFAMRHKEKYTAIFWLNANDSNSLKLSFRDVARQISNCCPTNELFAGLDLDNDLDLLVDTVKKWCDLEHNVRWLLIYDNHDNPKLPTNNLDSALDLRDFLPRFDQGCVIITTRSSQVNLGKRIHVQKLPDMRDSLAILSNASKRDRLEDDHDAIELVEELDGLPLALSTAGAYLEHVAMSFEDYLWLYRSSWLKLQEKSPQLDAYNGSLYSTWQITYDRIAEMNGLSAYLLRFWAYFDRQDIWYELVRHPGHTNDEIAPPMDDELSFHEAMMLLATYGMVDIEEHQQDQIVSRSYSVHSCVHSWTVSVINRDFNKHPALLAIQCVTLQIPTTSIKNWWIQQRRLLPHVARQETFIAGNSGHEFSAMHYWGRLYGDQGELPKAENMIQRALAGLEDCLGTSHEMTYNALHSLGIVYQSRGKLIDAERAYLRALHGYEELLGPKNPLTLGTVQNLGLVYREQGKLTTAEEMYTRALDGFEENLGSKNISTLMTITNLATVYYEQGKLAKAEELWLHALNGCEEVMGAKDISALFIRMCLGISYRRQNKLAEAEEMLTRALHGYEEALGLRHPSTLLAVCSLGTLRIVQGKLSEAEELLTRALRDCSTSLGSKHRFYHETSNNLGIVYSRQDLPIKAEAMFVQALQGHEEAVGVGLVSTYLPSLRTKFAYAEFCSQSGRKEMAMRLYAEAMIGFIEVQGPSSEAVLDTKSRIQAIELEMAYNPAKVSQIGIL